MCLLAVQQCFANTQLHFLVSLLPSSILFSPPKSDFYKCIRNKQKIHCFLIPYWSWEPQYSIPLHSDVFVSNTVSRFYMYTYLQLYMSLEISEFCKTKVFLWFLIYIQLLAQNLAQSCWLHGCIKPKIESEAIKCPRAY